MQVLRDTGNTAIGSTLLTAFEFLYLFFTDTFNVKLKSRPTIVTIVTQCYLIP